MASAPFRFLMIVLVIVMISLAIHSCSKHETFSPPQPEYLQRVPCEICEAFAGYYELRDVSVNTINGIVLWSPLPVSTIDGKIYSGYLVLNTMSQLTVYRSGEVYDSQEFTTSPFAFTSFYNYWIISDSAMTVGPEKEAGSFFPHLGPGISLVDTIIWDKCRYVRQEADVK